MDSDSIFIICLCLSLTTCYVVDEVHEHELKDMECKADD